jgi:hypothetical protein
MINPTKITGSNRAKKDLVLEVWWALLKPMQQRTIAHMGIRKLPTKGITLRREVAPDA